MEKDLEKFIDKIYEYNSFSEETYRLAELIIADTVASVLYGLYDKETNSLIMNKALTKKECGVKLLNSDIYLTKNDLIQVYGIAAVSNELDEGNTEAKGHPGSQIIPALLTINDEKLETKDVLSAFIKSYEISSRISRAINLDDKVHPHGTWGLVGYVAFKCLLDDSCNKNQLTKAIKLALSLPLATSWFAAEKGQTVRNVYSGIGSLIAENILDLSKANFETNETVILDVYSNKLGNKVNFDTLLESDFTTPMVNKNYFKVYPSCRFTHGAIDAVERLMRQNNFNSNDIKKINVETYSLAARCNTKNPKTQLESKFSIPYSIAITLLDLNRLNSYSHNKKLARNMIEKVNVYENKDYTAALPNLRLTSVTIEFNNGNIIESLVEVAKGEYTNPVSQCDLIKKYNTLFRDRNIQVDISHLMNIRKENLFFEWINKIG